jgi:hypothetical protein
MRFLRTLCIGLFSFGLSLGLYAGTVYLVKRSTVNESPSPIPLAPEVRDYFNTLGSWTIGCQKNSTLLTIDALPFEQTAQILPYGTVYGKQYRPYDHVRFIPDTAALSANTVSNGSVIAIFPTKSSMLDVPAYQIIIRYSCTEYLSYDLVTELSEPMRQLLEQRDSGDTSPLAIPTGTALGKVDRTAGLGIAYIDFSRPALGFPEIERVNDTPWTVHVASFSQRYTQEVRSVAKQLFARTGDPFDGDIITGSKGTLSGCWYEISRNNTLASSSICIWSNPLNNSEVLLVYFDRKDGTYQAITDRETAPNPNEVSTTSGAVSYRGNGLFAFAQLENPSTLRFAISATPITAFNKNTPVYVR